MSCFIYFGKNVVPIGHGNSFRLVLQSHGKVMENDFPKRVVTLFILQVRPVCQGFALWIAATDHSAIPHAVMQTNRIKALNKWSHHKISFKIICTS